MITIERIDHCHVQNIAGQRIWQQPRTASFVSAGFQLVQTRTQYFILLIRQRYLPQNIGDIVFQME